MFPSQQLKRPHDPITDKVVWHACRQSALRAGITKPIHPHTLRHYTVAGFAGIRQQSTWWRPESISPSSGIRSGTPTWI
jgi:integrase